MFVTYHTKKFTRAPTKTKALPVRLVSAPDEELRRRDSSDVRILVVAQYERFEVLDLQTRLREKRLQHLADAHDAEDSRTDWQVVLTDAL